MTGWVPVEPAWAVPASAAIADLMWLSYGSWVSSRSDWAAGVMATAAWVRGGRPAPVSGRTDTPVTSALAEAEFWISLAVLNEHAGLPGLPAEALCVRLGVAYVAPRPDVNDRWARGTHETLRWLLGRDGPAGAAEPPMPVPVRRPDGTIPTVRELYEGALSDVRSVLIPEQRRQMLLTLEHDVARAHRLDAEIRAIQRDLAARV